MAESTTAPASADCDTRIPRVTIQFCTQCKWMLRAAYFAQELLSTFSTSLGEVSLQPSTGGTFTVAIHHQLAAQDQTQRAVRTVVWDRKTDGGFPETKELKRRVRDVIEPGRDLGHVDRHQSAESPLHQSGQTKTAAESPPRADVRADGAAGNAAGATVADTSCQDCK